MLKILIIFASFLACSQAFSAIEVKRIGNTIYFRDLSEPVCVSWEYNPGITVYFPNDWEAIEIAANKNGWRIVPDTEGVCVTYVVARSWWGTDRPLYDAIKLANGIKYQIGRVAVNTKCGKLVPYKTSSAYREVNGGAAICEAAK